MSRKALYRVPVGSTLILAQNVWRVVDKDDEGFAVESEETGEFTVLTYERVNQAIMDNDCKVLTPKQFERQKRIETYMGGKRFIEQFPEQNQRDARAKLGIVLAMAELENEVGELSERKLNRPDYRRKLEIKACEVAGDKKLLDNTRLGKGNLMNVLSKGRTLLDWRKIYEEYECDPLVLIRRDHMKGPTKGQLTRLSGEQERFIAYLLDRLLEQRKPKIKTTYESSKSAFKLRPEEHLRGFAFPSLTTIYTRWNAIPAAVKSAAQDGKRFAHNRFGAGSTDVRALQYGEDCRTDQCLLSFFTDTKGALMARALPADQEDSEQAPNEVRRLWLLYIFDVATRKIIAWIVAEAPHRDHQKALLRMAMMSKERVKQRYGCKQEPPAPVIPTLVVSDNGVAARNADVMGRQLGLGIDHELGRTYHSTDNSFGERPFGTIEFGVLNFEEGYTGNRPDALNDYDGKAQANLTPDELMGILSRYFIDEYPFAPNWGTGMFGATPQQKFEEAVEKYGGIEAPNPEEIRLHLGETKRLKVNSEGVRFMGIPYNSTQLQSYFNGSFGKVNVHLNPDDIRYVSITIEGETEVLEAELRMTILADLTLYEALQVMRDAAEANPEKKALHQKHLEDAKRLRVQRSGFFPDSDLPSSYERMEQCERIAEHLMNVEYINLERNPEPGLNLMDRGPETEIQTHPKVDGDANPPTESAADKSGRIFPPLKKSKL